MKVYALKNLRNISIGPLLVNGKSVRLGPWQTIESDNEADFKGFRGNPYYLVEEIDVPDTIQKEAVKAPMKHEAAADLPPEPIMEVIVDEVPFELPAAFEPTVKALPTYDVFLTEGNKKKNSSQLPSLMDVGKLLADLGAVGSPKNISGTIGKKFIRSNGKPITHGAYTIRKNA